MSIYVGLASVNSRGFGTARSTHELSGGQPAVQGAPRQKQRRLVRRAHTQVVHLLAQRATNEDRCIDKECAVALGRGVVTRKFRVQAVADGHGGVEAAEIVSQRLVPLFRAALERASRAAHDEAAAEDGLENFVTKALERTNVQLQEAVAALPGRSGTTLALMVWLVDDAAIPEASLRGWALVIGDSQFAVSAARDGSVLDCVVAQKDLATQTTTQSRTLPRRGMSFAQAICGHVRSRTGRPLPFDRPLAPQDVEELMLYMEGDVHGDALREVLMLNESRISNPEQTLKLPHGQEGKYFNNLQCTRSLEARGARRITLGIVYSLEVSAAAARAAGGVRCICFCDGFCDNGALTDEQVTRGASGAAPLLAMLGGEPGVLRGTVLESRLVDPTGRFVKMHARIRAACAPDDPPPLPPMGRSGEVPLAPDPAASLRWLQAFHLKHSVPAKLGMIDAPWQRGIKEALAHWVIRLPLLSDGRAEATLLDVAYLAALRLSADNTSGVQVLFLPDDVESTVPAVPAAAAHARVTNMAMMCEAPPPEGEAESSSSFKVGDAVVLHGLQGAFHLNGSRALVQLPLERSTGRHTVLLQCSRRWNKAVNIKAANLRRLAFA